MISNDRLAKIYEEYEILYDLYAMTEDLSSKKSFEYMVGYFARINASDVQTNQQLAFNFLDSENRSDERLKQALNRLSTSSEWAKAETLQRIEEYLIEQEYSLRNPKAPDMEILREAYEDIRDLKGVVDRIRDRAMNDPQYRKAFIELFLAGTNNNQAMLKAIMSPDGFDDE